MDFSGDFGLWQRKIAEGLEGTARRMSAFAALSVESGHAVLDIGCGGGHLVRELALAVGNGGRAVGLDVNPEQIQLARDLCSGLAAAELVEGQATDMPFDNGAFDSVASIQTLEYVSDVDTALNEVRRILRPGGKIAFISVLWDHWHFHGPEPELNERVLEAFRAHCTHQMLPILMPGKLATSGFGGTSCVPIAFMNQNLHENTLAFWGSKIAAGFAVGQGVSEEDARRWLEQLEQADKEGRFAFISVPVLTTATAI